MTRTISNAVRFIHHVPKAITWKWWNEFMNQFYTLFLISKQQTNGPNSNLYNALLLMWTLLAFVKFVFFIWIYFVICFISKWYTHVHENSFGGFFLLLCCLLIYIFRTNMGTFSLEIIYIFLFRRSPVDQNVIYFSCYCHSPTKNINIQMLAPMINNSK